MSITVTIRDTATGLAVNRTLPMTWDEDAEFYFSEGSMSCDCSRAALYFETDPNLPCATRRFIVAQIHDGDGKEVYSEQ